MHLNEYIDYDISLSATFICRGVETYSHTAGGAGRGGAGGHCRYETAESWSPLSAAAQPSHHHSRLLTLC